MQISARKVVHIHYTLTNDAGDILDTSRDHAPLAYIHGMGNLIPGLENALHGRAAGDHFQVSILPADAYGEHDEELVQAVPRSAFQGVDQIEPGMRFQAQGPEGRQLLTVVGVDDEEVILDGNHPMAGMTLNFDVEITGIRDATEEELDHGHVHGPGGHHHG
jgi:FKBP-type peptidyl-prolyl cis-trans isomerase SlyD